MGKLKAMDSLPLGENILSMEHITKIYPNGFIANQDVTFTIRKGEIHGLVGENGAGKTTLMKVLFGQEPPEEGEIILAGSPIHISNPLQALDYGIGMVHQHFMLVDSLTVAENMVLGQEPTVGGMFFDYKKAVKLTEEVSRKYDLPIDPHKKISDLSVGYKQRVEILKILLRGAKILLLDEPTAVLTPQETKELFVQLQSLKDSGHTIVFISHKLNEIIEICDRISVLRKGKLVGAANVSDITESDIARMMVGREVFLDMEKELAKPNKPVLEVKNLTYYDDFGVKALDDLSFTLRRGEILGIAGVEGNGQAQLSDLIAGLNQIQEGDILIDNKSIRDLSIRQIRENGASLIHEDRMDYGAAADGSVLENIISDRYYDKKHSKNGLLKTKDIQDEVNDYIQGFGIKCDNSSAEVRTLSGGNIQKVVAARELTSSPKMILANQPTRGIDIGATELIRNKLVELRDNENAGVLLISADISEVLTVSDSIIVMYNGKISAYFSDAKKINEEILGEYMLGVKNQTKEEIGGVLYV